MVEARSLFLILFAGIHQQPTWKYEEKYGYVMQLRLRKIRCSSCFYILNYIRELESKVFVREQLLDTKIQKETVFIDLTKPQTFWGCRCRKWLKSLIKLNYNILRELQLDFCRKYFNFSRTSKACLTNLCLHFP